jgi:cystathionine beta-lyase
MWLDFRALGLKDEELAKILVEKAGVGLSPGHIFGPGGKGFQRINIASPKSVLEEAIEKIVKAFIQ